MGPRRFQRGFTLVEVLVSTSIFAVVSVAMIGIYATATELVRLGESRRAATDEATTVLAMLENDLRRMTPKEAGGFFFAQSPNDTTHVSGCMTIAFVIDDPQSINQRAPTGTLPVDGSRLVMWMTDLDGRLWRKSEQAPASNRLGTVMTWYASTANFSEIAKGCVMLGIEVPDIGLGTALPTGTAAYVTEGTNADPFPTRVRLTVGFNGGEVRAPRGRLISSLTTGTTATFGLMGLRQTASPCLLRIGDPTVGPVEWIEATKTSGQTWEVSKRAVWRTTESSHAKGTLVTTGSFYSLTRSIGR